MNPTRPLAFVDLETTGATAANDRITEIGIVEVDTDGSVRQWQQLVNPGVRISSFIEQLTGISNAMVASAPPFAEVAAEALGRLQHRLFIAHNARFDYGFLRSEFKRAGLAFHAPVLCTVKLSRSLYPEHKKHNLDALIERHNLQAEARHRALADAQLIHQFWEKIHQSPGPDMVRAAIRALNPHPNLPEHLEPTIDDLPSTPGSYRFFDEHDKPLYLGKAKNLRKRVITHFNGNQRAPRDLVLAPLVRRIEWCEESVTDPH
jgi:DNA polymerase-3 subunit epsilon